MRRALLLTAITLPLLLAVSIASSPTPARADEFPSVIQLPDGWQPEGIVVANGMLYSGSRRHGGIYAASLETGLGQILVPGREGSSATGLKFDDRSGYIFAAGAANGDLNVYDSASGARVGSYKLAGTPGPTFINDVIITPSAAYLTDSMRPVLYRVPLGQNGDLPAPNEVQVINLTGDYVHQTGFNLNGIEAASDDKLIVVQTNTGLLFEVNPFTGRSTRIVLGSPTLPFGDTVVGGDGLLLDGTTFYVVRGAANEVAKIEFSADYSTGHIITRLVDPNFDTPTTVTRSGAKIYVVNGRFNAGTGLNVPYTVVALDEGLNPSGR